ncbi:MAG: BtrH N-terminal domain-containing protein [Desulfobacterales bacterium]
MKTIRNFEHRHFAHCETGVMSTLLKYSGLELSEPMVFGLSGAICFAYLSFLKMGNMPLVSYRMFPGHIVKKFPQRLGVEYFRKTYKDQDLAMAELDDFVEKGQLVGLQTSAYFTTYFPPEMRFQFNAHNIIIIGKERDEYLVSDPVFDHIERINTADLKKARFARGLSAPKGLVHHPVKSPADIDLQKLIKQSIKKTVHMMLYAPVPWIGTKGINHLSRHIFKLARNQNSKYTRHFLGNIVRMQEEIGTGGGGFRFMYAAFLQEAHDTLGLPLLKEASDRMTAVGDQWRKFALECAKIVKSKESRVDLPEIAQYLRRCGDSEKQIYRMLKTVK